MKKILKAGWLVMAAALMLTMAACSSDDNIADEPTTTEPQAVSTVHVTVGAGIGDSGEAATRSAVNVEDGKRRLTFTAGDKLYVYAQVTAQNDHILVGTLSIGDITNNRLQASFSGNLQVCRLDNSNTAVPSTYTFTGDDPLNECSHHQAYLIAEDMPADCYSIVNNWAFQLDQSKSIAVDDPDDATDDCVSTLMKTALRVMSYESYKTEDGGSEGTKMFRNFKGDPILHCTIGGLIDNKAYTVTLLGSKNESDYTSHTGSLTSVTYSPAVTTDATGTAHFAISLLEDYAKVNAYWSLKIEDADENTHYVMLGQKEMAANKVYRKVVPAKALSEVADEDVGKVIALDGRLYATASAATAAGTTGVAKIIYVGSSTSSTTYTHGMALALADEDQMNWETAMSTCSGKNTSTPVTGALWMLPSLAQLNVLIDAVGSDQDLRTGFSGIGGTNLEKDKYWTSTEDDDNNARAKYYDFTYSWSEGSEYSNWGVQFKGWYQRVRAVLVF